MIGLTILGAFVLSVVIAIIFILICGAIIGHDEMRTFEEGCVVGMALVIIMLLLWLSTAIVNFKQNPENYGYTRIEQEDTNDYT